MKWKIPGWQLWEFNIHSNSQSNEKREVWIEHALHSVTWEYSSNYRLQCEISDNFSIDTTKNFGVLLFSLILLILQHWWVNQASLPMYFQSSQLSYEKVKFKKKNLLSLRYLFNVSFVTKQKTQKQSAAKSLKTFFYHLVYFEKLLFPSSLPFIN